jgi:succinate dehydrogenase / fumarate reductase membrane anchor subunit
LQKARGLGSAKEGAAHWWMQRVTAVALLPLMAWLILSLSLLDGFDHAMLSRWVAQPLHAVLLIATVLALCWHSALGLQVIFEDYIAAMGLRLVIITMINFAHILFAIVSIFFIMKIALDSV